MTTTFVSPRLLLIGGGAVGKLAEVLAQFGLSQPLVVTDPWMVSSGTVEKALAPLRAAGITAGVFSDTVPDPTDTVIEAGVAAMKAGDYDCLIGFGGGSPMDTAKAMAILGAAPPGAKMRDFKVPAQANRGALPVIGIPTTAGTGSEATRFTVITDTERDEKMLDRRPRRAAARRRGGLRTHLLPAAAHHRRYRHRQPDPCAGSLRLQARQ